MAKKKIRLLMVEDEKIDQERFIRYVKKEKLPYDYDIASTLKEAIDFIKKKEYDLVITDFKLPDGTGLEIFKHLDNITPVIVSTGSGNEEVAVEFMKKGAYDYIIKDPDQYYVKIIPLAIEKVLKLRSSEKALEDFNKNLKIIVAERTVKLNTINVELQKEIKQRKNAEVELKKYLDIWKKLLKDFIFAMEKAVEVRDPFTAGHQYKVGELVIEIAREMGYDEDRVNGVYLAALIHDIGKVYVPAQILTKPSTLSSVEFQLIQTHPDVGYEILNQIDFPWPLAEIIRQHHERMDGSGYPNGLKNDKILEEAKIISVADVVEAISSHRPYRPAHGIEKALEEIEKNKGILYDKQIVEICLTLFNKKNFKFSKGMLEIKI